jgi:hypothetical protein
MVKVIYEPFKEIVIKEYVHYEKIGDLLYPLAQLRVTGTPVALNWANGVLLFASPMEPNTDQLAEEFLKGRMYFATVVYSIMPEYKPILETREKIQVPIINASSNPIIREIAEWLIKQK